MAETRRYALGNQLNIEQILLEAQHRWLRPAEICEILRNHNLFRIAPEPANMPPSGSLFLFDRKVLRYFRKDGHNWRKKKDGKTVKEAHERLKAGSVDVLHCYYAHGEENENFQRRSYWMLEEELSHIVLVHYREVKGNRASFNRFKEAGETIPSSQETEDIVPNSEMDCSVSSSFHPDTKRMPSQTTDTTSMNSAHASEYEDAESAYNHQASSRYHSFLESQQRPLEKIDAGLCDPHNPVPFQDVNKDTNDSGLTFESHKHLEFPSWDDVLENCPPGVEPVAFQPSFSSTQSDTMGDVSKQGYDIAKQHFTNTFGGKQEFGNHLPVEEEWQTSGCGSSNVFKWSTDQKLHWPTAYDPTFRFPEHVIHESPLSSCEPCHTHSESNDHIQSSNTEQGAVVKSDSEINLTIERKSIHSSAVKQHLLDGSLTEGLKKLDSFNRWMSKELGDVNDAHMQSSSGAYWDTDENGNGVDDPSIPQQEHLDTYMLGPSLSHDQLFSIIDFSPNWAYAGSEIKVLITGRFLKSQQEAANFKWSCMFGEVEVPAEVVVDGVLRCCTPIHDAGRVPFYVTCSNRLACSEVREFEYRVNHVQHQDTTDNYSGSASEDLYMRFGKLLCLSSDCAPNLDSLDAGDISQLNSKISLLLKDDNDEWDQILKHTSEVGFSLKELEEQLLQKLLKEKLHGWLLHKVAEGGKGPSVLDEDGQGVLHFAAALGYDWALEPTVIAGVSVNFRDVNGWTALHWAASCGRERTVASLISLDAAPGALTDPSPQYPSGRTPADLASANGHKGIAGYLAESSLSAHLHSLEINTQDQDAAESSGAKAVQSVSERSATPISEGDLPYGLSLKDSLAAVCNATQAAARIHQVFRVQSFQQRQLKEFGDDTFGMSDERALSLIAVKTKKTGPHDVPLQAAAIRIQNKFRSWKGRKEFLIIRQQIVKIQAHVRGHQVRKTYKKITWSVGILEKVILRWRRKGSGLRGFKLEQSTESPSIQHISSKEDDYDFLKEGRKQTEERLQKALARVKSMVQYPEARDQYRRLLNVVTEIQESKVVCDRVMNSAEDTPDFEDDLIDLDALFDDV
ncbi:IQ domain-containing protein/CG-1 domain-containing protein/Ank_2 domain-containing protein [Cephalotus follicularis]|uniref:IQ domain-containing protein/CG-1 domain-containing protein/Ank_2 domain-containing protein n=1 Tax=Cephalotus follicularis TaxID=3775 RepID=A0A1Q3CX72_CEPFO|nr:IQ domain-containing protein/CG-1 domain-containing protein/Ank_2 domain-containing protein [Cephalotus follicularis]